MESLVRYASLRFVIPAKVGIQSLVVQLPLGLWIPAFAGMTILSQCYGTYLSQCYGT